MLSLIKKHLPPTWDRSDDVPEEQVLSDFNSEEYNEVLQEAKTAGSPCEFQNITRVQDIFSYGQFLIREQLLLVNHQQRHLFRVRRYLKISKLHEQEIIKYNLDPRRCGIPYLKFSKELPLIGISDLIVVVKVLTDDPNASEIAPATSSDYFIEYIIKS